MLYDFYEWDLNDTIENIKRMKLIHVEKEIFEQLLSYDGRIDSDFLLKIYRTCEIYTSKKVKVIDYCCLFSDGNRALAIEFNEKGKPIFKSKLLIDEEEEVALLASNLEKYSFTYEIGEKILESRFFTRTEMIIRKYLMKEIEACKDQKDEGKLRYLYEEYFEKEGNSFSMMKEDLLNSLKKDVDTRHQEIYQLLQLSNQKKQV